MRQAGVEFTVRTDLALEEREKVQGSEVPGIRVREWETEETGIRVTEVAVCVREERRRWESRWGCI